MTHDQLGIRRNRSIRSVREGGGRALRVKGRRLCIKSNGPVEKVSHEPVFSVHRRYLFSNEYNVKMRAINVTIVAITCCFLVSFIIATDAVPAEENYSPTLDNSDNVQSFEHEAGSAGVPLNRQKRTLLLKKKLLGAGLVGFGLGLAKGYKAGYYTAPSVRHVYLSPPSPAVKYIEYVEKPIFVERIIERPAPPFVKPIVSAGFKDPSSSYG
ncbi:uncharacterized protein LOC116431862 isoform X2 [Nomia melanderi]